MQTLTIEKATRYVQQYTAVRDPAMVAKVAQRMVDTGECAWHALAQISGKPCWCAKCAPTFGMNR